jgi:hypothetical protein
MALYKLSAAKLAEGIARNKFSATEVNGIENKT